MDSTDDDTVPPTLSDFQCALCSKVYNTKSGLAKHIKSCGSRHRTSCKYCGATFSTFSGVRLHEIRAHRAQESTQRTHGIQDRSELDTVMLMAETEAVLPEGAHLLKILAEKTGLTRYQVRHRREKADYKELLAIKRQRHEVEPAAELLISPHDHAPTPSAA